MTLKDIKAVKARSQVRYRISLHDARGFELKDDGSFDDREIHTFVPSGTSLYVVLR